MADSWLDTDLQEQRKQAAEQQQQQLAGQAVLNPWASSALQGLTYGFGDEMTAGVRSLFGTPYQEALAQERANQSQFAQAHPYANVGVQMVGALPHILLSRGRTGPATFKRAMADAAIRGAAEGAVQGFGEGEGGPVQRLKDAAVSGTVGGVLSAPMELLTRGLSVGGLKLWDRVAPAFSPKQADEAAARKVAQNVERQGGMDTVRQNVDAYGNKVDEATQAGLPDPKLTLGEVAGGQTKSALDAALSMPGRGAAALDTQLAARQTERMGRVRQALSATFGDQDDAFTAKAKLYESRKQTADPLYRAAFDNARPPQASDLDLMKRIPQEAVTDARTIARMEGRDLSFKPVFREDGTLDLDASGVPTVEDMHQLKVGLDNYIQRHSPNGIPDTLANRAAHLRNGIRDRVDTLTEDHNGVSLYKQAREHWAGDTSRIEAINLGRRAVDMDQHELRAQLARMTESERAYFVNGFFSDLTDRLDKVHISGNASPVRAVFDTQKSRDAAETALSTLGLSRDEIRARMTRLKDYFENEATGHANEGTMRRGSVTAGRTAWQKDLAIPAIGGTSALTAAISGQPELALTAAVTTALAAGAKGVNAMRTEKMNDAMLRILGNSDPAQQRILLDALERNAQRQVVGPPRGAFGRGGATVAGQGGAMITDNIFSPDDPRLQQ